jgi:hypothetical protein
MPQQFGYLKRSQFVVGLAKAVRGLRRDVSMLAWVVKRNRQIASYLKTYKLKKLQLGASNNVLDGWLNTAFFPNHDSVVYLGCYETFPIRE